jgi:hypothetical protein
VQAVIHIPFGKMFAFMSSAMGRRLRYMKKPNTTFEVTSRTIQGRLLLRPSKELNRIVLGILGRFLERYPGILLHLVIVASNHIHMLLTAACVELLADFMRDVNSSLAREAGRLHRWKEKFWGRRYTMIAVADDDEEDLLKRAVYILQHGAKEGLVLSPKNWPGINCIEAVTRGKKLYGTWYDRTKEYEAARAGIKVRAGEFVTKYEVPLSPLPCFENLSERERRARYRAMVADIERETRKKFSRGGRRVLGVRSILKQHPHRRPGKIKKKPAPLFHCSNPDKWKEYRDDYRWFVQLYQTASKRLRSGDLSVCFPKNCFPPRLAFSGPDPPG